MKAQDKAADLCNDLYAMIEVCKPLFHMASKRKVYWQGLVVKTRNLIRGWHDTDVKQLNPERVKAQRKKLFRLVKKSKAGGIPRENVDMAYAAWRNHASKGNSYHLLQRMDKYYRDLWKGENQNAENHQAPNDAR